VSRLDRRGFLTRSALTTLGAAAGLGAGLAADAGAQAPPSDYALEQRALGARIPFAGRHQAGILTPAPENVAFVALDSVAPDRGTLIEGLQALSGEARRLCDGDVVGVLELDDPPPDSGILGAVDRSDSQTVTIAFGASLFDGRYGLAARRPKRLIEMPSFTGDLLDPTRTGGDVLVQICAAHRDTVVHTVRELMRAVAGRFAIRWTLDGFKSAQRGPTPRSSTRNLFAFRDGTANPDVSDARLMSRLVWLGGRSGEPAWAADGTYQVVRTIRMHVEFWDRVGMFEQQNMIGRERVSGAPIGGTSEFEEPRFDLDPHGHRIPLDAHIRLANPRTEATADQRILRRGYNYHRGVDPADNLDQGLIFVAFNQDIQRQFATIQTRLMNEPMLDYITAVGGGYFFAPPGVRGEGDWVGSGLLS
jgi:deferrochelatase/peroxidase EfeB